MFVRIIQRLAEEVLDAARIGLIRLVLAERVVQDLQEVFGVQAMAQVGNEADVLLGGAAEFQDGQAGLASNVGEELIESPAWPRGGESARGE